MQGPPALMPTHVVLPAPPSPLPFELQMPEAHSLL
jgi:hypothetical protein